MPAYWLVASDGGIFSFGGATYYGSTGNMHLNKPIVGLAATPDGGGYWLVASDGGIFSYGDALFHGSTGNLHLNRPIVGMTPTPDGGGYWLVASDGGIFTFGDANFYGSTGAMRLNEPIVGMAATPDGRGYWLVASDGGIFTFGTAGFYGSTGAMRLNQPIIGMMAGPGGTGYVLVASDGGTFTFGTAPFFGSLGGIPLKAPISAAATTPGDSGYWFSDITGEVSAFGRASYYGSAPAGIGAPIVGMVNAVGTGAFVGSAFPSGSYGYDVSKFNMNSPTCTTGLPPGEHNISIVEVDGSRRPGFVNPCLAAEGDLGRGRPQPVHVPLQPRALLEARHQLLQRGLQRGHPGIPRRPGRRRQHQRRLVDRRRGCRVVLVGVDRQQRPDRGGRHRRVAQHRGHRHRRDLRQSRNVELHCRQLPAVGSLLDGQLAQPAERSRDLRRRPQPEAKEQLPTGPVEFVQYSNSINGADGDYAC